MDKMDKASLGKGEAWEIRIRGRVQGVGFRPFIYRIAKESRVKGFVQNNMDGVFIHGEGNVGRLQDFYEKLDGDLPPLAKVYGVSKKLVNWLGMTDFFIKESENKGASNLVIPVDAHICKDCLHELKDKKDGRYQYPFINCTNCGPRYSLIQALPYDRINTTMNEFPMCPTCQKEYDDPHSRRHHAQPNACPQCGPKLLCWDANKEPIAKGEEALGAAISAIKAGKVVAIKGIGGFQLACDASNEAAVLRLKDKKKRPNKPLAVMAKNIEVLREVAYCSAREEKELYSPEAPIILLKSKEVETIAPSTHPGLKTIGMFLPYSPLHMLLMEHFDFLVMTSGNLSGEPMIYEDEDMLTRGDFMADIFLGHDRKIERPIDDSVIEIRGEQLHFYRRARGFVPEPFATSVAVDGIVALGGSLKNTFTFGRGKQVFLTGHNGDLENIVAMKQAHKLMEDFLSLTKIETRCFVVDKHPNYPQKQWLGETDLPIVEAWHHHAHFVSCIADNELPLEDDYIGVILDGTGLGQDGKIWGFEWLVGNVHGFERISHAQYQPLAGGEAAIRDNWKLAVAWLVKTLGDDGVKIANTLFSDKKQDIVWLEKMLDKNISITEAGTCGRLFDIVSALTGCCTVSTYEGEAAILLSELARDEGGSIQGGYPYSFQEVDGLRTFMTDEVLLGVLKDVLASRPTDEIAIRFHETIVRAIVEECERIAEDKGLQKVVFSGGSMHNSFFEREFRERLKAVGLQPYFHQRIPCNDGGLSFGQAMIAAYLEEDEPSRGGGEYVHWSPR